MKWSPVFTDDVEKIRALNIIHYVKEEMLSSNLSVPGLLGGKTGVSLFWSYFFYYCQNQTLRKLGIDAIQDSMNYAEQFPLPGSFCNGISGILWGFCHLNEIGVVGANINEIVDAEIDK